MAVFSNKFIRDRILELSAALFFSEDISLTIRIPAIRHKGILAFLRILWGFYWQKVTDPSVKPNIFGPLYINMYLSDEKGIESYTEFWRKHVEKFLRYNGKMFKAEMYHWGKKSLVERPLFHLLPPELEDLFPVFLNHEEIKKWIEKQLEKEPDWFMPHLVWVKLGFKQRKENLSVDSLAQVYPPFFHQIMSPSLPKDYGLFDNLIQIVDRKGDENSIRALCNWIIISANWRDQDFYRSWRILRKECRDKRSETPLFGEVARILDEALRKYIIADRKPNVNLKKALRDYISSKDVQSVETGIRDGKYPFIA
jgi:hypothetical protein